MMFQSMRNNPMVLIFFWLRGPRALWHEALSFQGLQPQPMATSADWLPLLTTYSAPNDRLGAGSDGNEGSGPARLFRPYIR